ncbi:MAG: hypothetical protein P0111_09635 [Nitrospira sp.]|nr:hypothetical protein [Nitrospira sp.]
MSPSAIVQKLWNYCNVLRDDGMSYDDYPSAKLRTGPSAGSVGSPQAWLPSTLLGAGRAGVEQLTYLLFVKMAMSVIQWLSWCHEIAPC